MAEAKAVADLQGIKEAEAVARPQVEAQVEAQAKVYDIPVYKTLKDRDGKDVEVLVQTIRTTKRQLEQAIAQSNARIAQAQAEVAELQAKLDAITALEA